MFSTGLVIYELIRGQSVYDIDRIDRNAQIKHVLAMANFSEEGSDHYSTEGIVRSFESHLEDSSIPTEYHSDLAQGLREMLHRDPETPRDSSLMREVLYNMSRDPKLASVGIKKKVERAAYVCAPTIVDKVAA